MDVFINIKNYIRSRAVWLSICLVFVALLGPIGIISAFTGEGAEVTITENDKVVSEISIGENDEKIVEAKVSPTGSYSYQWQIKSNDGSETWANIQGAESDKISITGALIEQATNSGGVAYIRCYAKAGDITNISDELKVTLNYNVNTETHTQTLREEGIQEKAALSETGSLKGDASSQGGELSSAEGTGAVFMVRTMALEAAENTEDNLVNLRIDYLNEKGTGSVYESYVDRVSKGQTYERIVSPTIIGYLPYYSSTSPSSEDYNSASDSAEDVSFTIPSDFTDDTFVVRVYYRPMSVSYTVKYYFQNIENDQYTERADLQVRKTAIAGTMIGDEELSISDPDETVTKGFIMLKNYPQQVASDGSSVYKCYYNRKYYLFKFNQAGGYGTEPIYAKYQATISVPNPIRSGYMFSGWHDIEDEENPDSTYILPSIMPAENKSFRAIWQTGTADYTVAYWWQDPDNPSDYASIGSRVVKNAEAGSTVSGTDDFLTAKDASGQLLKDKVELSFAHTHTPDCNKNFVYNESKTDKNVTIKGDGSTTINVYYDRKVYELKFIYAKELRADKRKVTISSPPSDGYYLPNSSDYFGTKTASPYTLENLLNNTGANWGKIYDDPDDPNDEVGVPTLSSEYLSRAGSYITMGTYGGESTSDFDPATNDGFNQKGEKFYFFTIHGRYGQNISAIWPGVDAFNAIYRQSARALKTGWSAGEWQKRSYLAGWTPENLAVYFSRDKNSNATIKGKYLLLDDKLLTESYKDDAYFLAFYENVEGKTWNYPREHRYNIWVEALPIDDVSSLPSTEKIQKSVTHINSEGKSVTENLWFIRNPYGDKVIKGIDNNGYTVSTAFTPPALVGFDYQPSISGGTGDVGTGGLDNMPITNANFFYTRKYYDVKVYNTIFTELTEETRNQGYYSIRDPYGLPQSNGDPKRSLPPDEQVHVPSQYDPTAYKFGGWYYTPNFLEGSEVGDKDVVPAHSLTIYARWVHITHKVRLFAGLNDMEAYEKASDKNAEGVPKPIASFDNITHEGHLPQVVEPPEKEGAEFIGWFYIKNGKKISFEPNGTPITQDLDLYCEWQSTSLQPYKAVYVLDSGETDEAWNEALNTEMENLNIRAQNENERGNPKINRSYEVTLNGEKRSYIYLNDQFNSGKSNESGFHRKVASDGEGYAGYGSTKTIEAKYGGGNNGLYDEFSELYFPTKKLVSIDIEEESDKSDPVVNVAVVTYAKLDGPVSYRVEYRDRITNNFAASTSYKSSTKAIATEKYVDIDGMLSDSMYKSIVISVKKNADGSYGSSDDNVIVFYYDSNETKQYYAVHYMFQTLTTLEQDVQGDNINPDHYEEVEETWNNVGTVGSSVDVVPKHFDGFSVKAARIGSGPGATIPNKTSEGAYRINVSSSGTDLYIYYTRDTESYKVYYLRYGIDVSNLRDIDESEVANEGRYPTEFSVAPIKEVDIDTPKVPIGVETTDIRQVDEDGNVSYTYTRPTHIHYQDVVTEKAREIPGWHCVSSRTLSLTMSSREENNTFFFYYVPNKYTVKYEVWSKGGGSLSKSNETMTDGAFTGSIPTAESGYSFGGWFLDENCTIPAVDSSVATSEQKGTIDESNNKFTPTNTNRDNLLAAPDINVFYAKFVPRVGSIKIRRTNTLDESVGAENAFLYKITKINDRSKTYYIALKGGEERTIMNVPVGAYEIDQLNNWNWRYTDGIKGSDNSLVVTEGDSVSFTVTFSGTARNLRGLKDNKWLSGNSLLKRSKKSDQ